MLMSFRARIRQNDRPRLWVRTAQVPGLGGHLYQVGRSRAVSGSIAATLAGELFDVTQYLYLGVGIELAHSSKCH
jgi:hypothetical protein